MEQTTHQCPFARKKRIQDERIRKNGDYIRQNRYDLNLIREQLNSGYPDLVAYALISELEDGNLGIRSELEKAVWKEVLVHYREHEGREFEKLRYLERCLYDESGREYNHRIIPFMITDIIEVAFVILTLGLVDLSPVHKLIKRIHEKAAHNYLRRELDLD